MAVIFVLSAQSRLPNLAPGVPHLQEVAGHFLAYAGLALLWRRALDGDGVRRAGWWALVAAVLYGISDEFHQSFVPNRSPTVFDASVDTLGAACALAARAAWQWRWGRLRPSTGRD